MKVFKILLLCLCGVALADDKEVAEHTNHFALDVYNKLTERGKNLVFSPFSLAIVLTFLWEGAGGNTATQIMKALHYDTLDHHEIDVYYENALRIMKSTPDLDMTLANAIFIKQGLAVKPTFLEHLNETYSATENSFTPDAAGLKKINDWVNDNTKGKIKKLLGNLPGDASMLLLNAIYFKGTWQVRFNTSNTKEMDFKESANSPPKKVQMMYEESEYEYKDDQNLKAQILSLYYKGNSSTRLMVFLPHEGTTLEQLEGRLTTGAFKSTPNALRKKVQVFLPKFKVENTLNNLAATLKALNIKDAFGNSADFSEITDSSVKVSQIIQKAIIEVNEEGTTAAAVTGAIIVPTSIIRTPIFKADRPFLYALHHIPTETILFMGRYAKVE